MRFYDATSGDIIIDGQNIFDVKIKSLRDNISYVGQEVQLFDGRIKDNISYSNTKATEAQIIEAAKIAEAHEFIMEKEEGYNFRVGQNGNRLSGGQRQRISIARAILKDAPILIFDEATSALDTVSENLIQKAVEKLSKGKTTLTIAHRLSTVINADEIFVLSNGKIVEQGSHEKLLEKNGNYAKLYSTQLTEK